VATRMLEEATQWGDEAFVPTRIIGSAFSITSWRAREAESHFEQAICPADAGAGLRADLRHRRSGLDVTTLRAQLFPL